MSIEINPIKTLETREQISKYHSRDLMRFILHRQSPAGEGEVAVKLGRHLNKEEIVELMEKRRAGYLDAAAIVEIKKRLEKFTDKEGYFPSKKLADILQNWELIDEFEGGWGKISDSDSN